MKGIRGKITFPKTNSISLPDDMPFHLNEPTIFRRGAVGFREGTKSRQEWGMKFTHLHPSRPAPKIAGSGSMGLRGGYVEPGTSSVRGYGLDLGHRCPGKCFYI